MKLIFEISENKAVKIKKPKKAEDIFSLDFMINLNADSILMNVVSDNTSGSMWGKFAFFIVGYIEDTNKEIIESRKYSYGEC